MNNSQSSSSIKKTNNWSSSLQNLLDQPPSNFSFLLILGGALFLIIFGCWTWFAQIEEVGKAQGKLIPKGKTYKIEPLDLGKVEDVPVKEGDEVKAGQVLVKFDSQRQVQDVKQLEEKLTGYYKELTQKESLLQKAYLQAQTQIKIAINDVQSQIETINLAQKKIMIQSESLSELELKEKALKERLRSLNSVNNLHQKQLQELLLQQTAHQKRIAKLRTLADEGAISEEYIFQAEESLNQIQRQITQNQLDNVTVNKGQIFEVEQSLKDLKFNIQQTEGELILAIAERQKLSVELEQKKTQQEKIKIESQQQLQQLQVEITQLKTQIAEGKKALSALQLKIEEQTIKAPVNGVISSLELQNIGQIVQSGDTIAELAPENMPLVLSALLPSQEAGLVKKGMPVKIKLDAYPYQDYGVINGTVSSISSDSKPHEQLGQVYQIEIGLNQNYIMDEGKKVTLKPGQTGNAEIILRRRRVLDILLEPIRGLQKGGLNL